MKTFTPRVMFNLPDHISERCEIVGSKNKITSNGPVVIWLKSSFRVHENPAIDAGRLIASSLELPVFVYHGIDERYPHASPRHHKVLLDAAVDMEKGCKKLELDYFLNVSREENRGKVLHELGKIASIIITDHFLYRLGKTGLNPLQELLIVLFCKLIVIALSLCLCLESLWIDHLDIEMLQRN